MRHPINTTTDSSSCKIEEFKNNFVDTSIDISNLIHQLPKVS